MTEKSDLTEQELYESERLINELNEREEQYERMSFDEKEEDEYEYEYEQLQYERIALLEQNEEDDARYHESQQEECFLNNNYSYSERQKIKSKIRKRQMTEIEKDNHRLRNTHVYMPQERIDNDRQRHLHVNMSQEDIHSDRQRHLQINMTPDNIHGHRQRNVHDHMTQTEIDNHRIRNRNVNMTEEQNKAHRQRPKFKKMEQEWDYNNPCEFCKCLYLKSEDKQSRKGCCKDGKWAINHENYDGIFPKLGPLPPKLKEIITTKCQWFSSTSAYYNNLFCIAVTGVDNGREGIGYEQMNMNACVKLNGRVYHR